MTRSILMLAVLAACGGKKPPEPATPDPEPQVQAQAPSVVKKADPEEELQEAIKLLASGRAGDVDSATQILVRIADHSPAARLNLGVAFMKGKDPRQAKEQFERVLAVDPSIPEAFLYKGAAQEALEDRGGALASYRAGILQHPEFMDLRVALIAALRGQGKLDEAISESKAALGINSNSLSVYNNFALAYMDKGDYLLAQFIFNKALQGIPEAENNAYIQANLGWVYYLEGDSYSAAAYLKKAVELDPELIPALVYLSRVYMDDHNYQDTVPLLEKAAELDPKNAQVQINLGIAYRGLGKFDAAKTAYNKALSLEPRDPSPHLNLGILLGDYLKDYDAAEAAFRKYLEVGGSRADDAQAYIKAIEKEKKLAEKRRKAEAERKAREQKVKDQKKLIEEDNAAKEGGEE